MPLVDPWTTLVQVAQGNSGTNVCDKINAIVDAANALGTATTYVESLAVDGETALQGILALIAGSGITLTQNDGNKTITITAPSELLNGVKSGMAPTISTTNIAIASGVGHCEGVWFTGDTSVAFAGAAADDYWVYADPADGGYKKATSDPGDGYLVLCQVTWNGTDTLSALVDLRAFGLVPWECVLFKTGAVAADVLAVVPVARDVFIEGARIVCGNTGGTSGSTIVDVHNGATTIFTTQSRRPTLAYTEADWTVATSGTPDGDRTVATGSYIVVEIDEVPGTASDDLGVIVFGRYM